jgi:hypothetical protein
LVGLGAWRLLVEIQCLRTPMFRGAHAGIHVTGRDNGARTCSFLTYDGCRYGHGEYRVRVRDECVVRGVKSSRIGLSLFTRLLLPASDKHIGCNHPR